MFFRHLQHFVECSTFSKTLASSEARRPGRDLLSLSKNGKLKRQCKIPGLGAKTNLTTSLNCGGHRVSPPGLKEFLTERDKTFDTAAKCATPIRRPMNPGEGAKTFPRAVAALLRFSLELHICTLFRPAVRLPPSPAAPPFCFALCHLYPFCHKPSWGRSLS